MFLFSFSRDVIATLETETIYFNLMDLLSNFFIYEEEFVITQM